MFSVMSTSLAFGKLFHGTEVTNKDDAAISGGHEVTGRIFRDFLTTIRLYEGIAVIRIWNSDDVSPDQA